MLFPGGLAISCLLRRPIKTAVYQKLLYVGAWVRRTLAISPSALPLSLRPLKEERTFSDRHSEMATRNLFSWTFFTEGIRTEEKSLWEHEWLRFIVERDSGPGSSESSSSGSEDEAKDSKFENIRRWQEDVSAEAFPDSDRQPIQIGSPYGSKPNPCCFQSYPSPGSVPPGPVPRLSGEAWQTAHLNPD